MANAPPIQIMSREAVFERFGEMEVQEGVHEYSIMVDGWRLHRETWYPKAPAKAIVLFSHGLTESTRTISVRRLAFACLKRGYILEAYDAHGHGDSLNKHGKLAGPAKFQGTLLESFKTNGDHAVEMAELVLEKHRLPLVIMGHSSGGEAMCMATDRIIAKCEQFGVPFGTALYAAPGLGVSENLVPCRSVALARCATLTCRYTCFCCNCCGQPCIPFGDDHMNPGQVLGPANTMQYLNCDCITILFKPHPDDRGGGVKEAAERMTKLTSGLVYMGAKDDRVPVKSAVRLGELIPALTVDVKEGLGHEFMNVNKSGDRTSVEAIEDMLTFADKQLSLDLHNKKKR